MGDGIAHLLAFPNFVIFSIVYIASIFLRAPVLIVSEYVKKEISFYSTVHLFKKKSTKIYRDFSEQKWILYSNI